uniref:Uncharacterized protein n=1 Tax=viral metagenome TaxID=1070528 RepID=A0A6H1ZD72_9ZZZZ
MKETNAKFAKNNRTFTIACGLAKTPATPRQASKFRRGRGKATRFARKALSIVNQETIEKIFKKEGGEENDHK